MTTIEPLIPGIYARSEQLVQTTRDYDRDRVDVDDLSSAQRRDIENLIGVQVAAGYRTVSPGLLTWQDHFRPFDAVIPALEPEALTRFIDTNTFYRRPDIEGDVEVDESAVSDAFDDHVPDTGSIPSVGTLPSPTAWVTAAQRDDGTYPDPDRARAVAEWVYPPVLDFHADRGVETVVLTDPWFARYDGDTGAVAASLETLAATTDTDLDVLVQLPFQDAESVLHAIPTAAVDGVIVDLTETDREALATLPADTAVGLGLVDARSSLIERPDLLRSAIESAVAHLETDEVLVTPTGDLQHVPEPIARQKVRLVSEAAQTARDTPAVVGGETA